MSALFTRQDEPVMTVLATPSELIILNAAIRHYRDTALHLAPEYRAALALLQRFQQRLVEHLPSAVQEGGT